MTGSGFPFKELSMTKHFRNSARYPNGMEAISFVHKTKGSSNPMLLFHFEGALLRSTSLFPYFMLVAFEAGGLLRSVALFLSYPVIWLLEEDELGLNIMVFLCFLGIKKETFRIGLAVLPKFFLEDIGWEGFEAVTSCERKMAASNLPRIMVEDFLKDYLGVEAVVARELKTFSGYYMGIMVENNAQTNNHFEELDESKGSKNLFGIGSQDKYADQDLFPYCKEVYFVSDAEKRNWHVLPRENYPQPLIFHDGRLAFRPTPASSLVLFMWLPSGLFLFFVRSILCILLPFNVSAPILAFSGTRTTVSGPRSSLIQNEERNPKGMLYVCNHRTLLDPLYISYALDKPVSTVTYSLSKFNELVSPIKTIRLTRDREKDRTRMETLLRLGNLVVCPEGTTCREPYLLRFSPLFAELTDDIVPVALDVQVNMFYGTTASGHKCLDPLFHFLNPHPSYSITFLDELPKSMTCQAGAKSRIEVANYVQNEIGGVLKFACTSLSRKDKYRVLAGNEGVNQDSGTWKRSCTHATEEGNQVSCNIGNSGPIKTLS